MMEELFNNLKPEDMNEIYPADHFGENATIGFVILGLIAHLSSSRTN